MAKSAKYIQIFKIIVKEVKRNEKELHCRTNCISCNTYRVQRCDCYGTKRNTDCKRNTDTKRSTDTKRNTN